MSHPPRIVIAGFGLVTPLGQSAWETFTALLAGRTITDRTRNLPPDIDPVALVRTVGCVPCAHHAGGDPAVILAERAAREASMMAHVSPAGTPAFLGTSKGALHTLAKVAGRDDLSRAGTPDAALAAALGPHGYLTHTIRSRLGLGVTTHHVAACASSLASLDAAAGRLRRTQNTADTALVISSEAALLPAFIHSYRRLGVLAPLTPAEYRERPLHPHLRQGFVLAEAGAAVLLRRLPPGVEPDIGQIELLDTAVAGEAHDLIRPAPSMDALAWVADQLFAHPLAITIDLLHPHAPGTPDHDPGEDDALRRALGRYGHAFPPVYAAKGALGHPLGASGLVATVLACLCLTTGQRPPMPWLDGDTVAPLTTTRTGIHAIVSAGFAGHVAGAIIRRW